MLLGQIFNSITAWNKLATVTMKPLYGYKVLKYVKLVQAEHAIAETQRVALIHEVTGTEDGEDAKIEPNTPEFSDYVNRLNEAFTVESELEQIDTSFESVLAAIGDKDDVLTVQDLAILEPFFKTE